MPCAIFGVDNLEADVIPSNPQKISKRRSQAVIFCAFVLVKTFVGRNRMMNFRFWPQTSRGIMGLPSSRQSRQPAFRRYEIARPSSVFFVTFRSILDSKQAGAFIGVSSPSIPGGRHLRHQFSGRAFGSTGNEKKKLCSFSLPWYLSPLRVADLPEASLDETRERPELL